MKTVNPSTMNFNNQNSLLSFIYDYEFRQIHKGKLQKSSLLKPYLNRYSLFTNLNKYNNFNMTKVFKNNISIFKNYKNINFSLGNITKNTFLFKEFNSSVKGIFNKNITFN